MAQITRQQIVTRWADVAETVVLAHRCREYSDPNALMALGAARNLDLLTMYLYDDEPLDEARALRGLSVTNLDDLRDEYEEANKAFRAAMTA